MKYFVTGATGFIGRRLVRQLAQQGHSVVALARDPRRADGLADLGAQVAEGDVTDLESMRAPMAGCDGVFHVAGWYKLGVRDRRPAWLVNVEGTRNVLWLMRELSIARGVYTSTLAVNSDTRGHIPDETYRFSGRHISEYDRTKAAAHDLALEMIDQGLPLVIAMPGLVYGPDDPSNMGFTLRQYLQRRLPLVPRGAAYCWAHVDDIAMALRLAMEKSRAGEVYMINGPAHTLLEALQIAERITGIPVPPGAPAWMLRLLSALVAPFEGLLQLPEIYSAETLRVSAGVTYLGDNTKARRELGYQPRPLADGLRETLAYEMDQLGIRPEA